MAKKKWLGCNEDCFNCEYDDCYRPAKMMHSTDEEEGRGKKNLGREGKRKEVVIYE